MSDYPMLISNKLHSFRNFTAQNYEKPGLSQARAFCILGTSPLPIGKWATSNLILVQQKRRSKSKDKRDASGKCGEASLF